MRRSAPRWPRRPFRSAKSSDTARTESIARASFVCIDVDALSLFFSQIDVVVAAVFALRFSVERDTLKSGSFGFRFLNERGQCVLTFTRLMSLAASDGARMSAIDGANERQTHALRHSVAIRPRAHSQSIDLSTLRRFLLIFDDAQTDDGRIERSERHRLRETL